jgi:RNA polymerase sigma-70 factor, ECF subfamily
MSAVHLRLFLPLGPMQFTDEQVASSCQRGNLADFAELYDRYVTPIYRFAYYRTFDRQLSEDITSQTFVQAMEKIGSFRPSRGPFAAWLYGIARNLVIDHFRAAKRTAEFPEDYDAPSDDDPAKDAATRMSYAEVRSALEHLEPLQRDVVLLRLWDGLSYREIAQITGKSEGNCKVMFSRTIGKLRGSLGASVVLLLLLSPLRL